MTHKHKKRLIKIIVAAVLFTVLLFLPLNTKLKAILFLIPYAIVGYDVIFSAAGNIVRGQIFDEQFLMSIATVGAFFIGEYSEAVLVMLFYQIGELFQSIAVGKSRKNIASLMDIRPESATVLRNGKEETISPDEVLKGEITVVRAGEKIPLDGVVLEGESSVNTAALTGESLPQDILAGDRVISGTVNLSGVIKVKTESVYTESTVAKILDLVENSTAKKSKMDNFITRFARYYTPCVVIGAVILALLPPIVLNGSFAEWLKRALIFLVVSCPCALVISVPLSFFGGIGGAARKGILIKGSNYIEALAAVDIFVFDKTGTLTKGEFKVIYIKSNNISEEKLLRLAALAEGYSNHPIARAIVNEYNQDIKDADISKVTEHAGMGIEAVIDNMTVFVGNKRLMDYAKIDCNEAGEIGTVVFVATEAEYLGYIVVADEIKKETKAALEGLKENGIIKTVMLTGDKREIGENVGKALDIDEIHTELMPDGKVKILEKLLGGKEKIAFVGDGINDAPVLARADVGIAMGAMGSDAAIEAADIVLMDDNPLKITEAVKISRKTTKIARQNIIFALAVKGMVLILGALGIADMWLAIFADVGVTVIAILNAMRAMR